MSSNINPNNIDGAYPVAGVDNDSQGFRNNFTNIKTNFTYAEDEINDLQSKVILKSALTGQTLDNDFAGSLIMNGKIQGFMATRVSLGNASTTAYIDYEAAPYYTMNLNGNVQIQFANWPTAGNYSWVSLEVTVTTTSYTLTMPTAVTLGTSTLQGCDTTTNTITFNRTGTYVFTFTTSDGGTTVMVKDESRNQDPIYLPSSEDLAPSAAISLSTTTSYFTTSSAETATLAAGYEGQTKVLAMAGDGGNMVITVANPGWLGAGTITFTAQGQACTLMYINDTWFCTGNNGATFA